MSEPPVNAAAQIDRIATSSGVCGLASRASNADIAGVREEADLDALIRRIQSDLRSGRTPARPARPVPERSSGDIRFRTELREIRGRAVNRADIARLAGRWLVPVLIFLVVLVATMGVDKL